MIALRPLLFFVCTILGIDLLLIIAVFVVKNRAKRASARDFQSRSQIIDHFLAGTVPPITRDSMKMWLTAFVKVRETYRIPEASAAPMRGALLAAGAEECTLRRIATFNRARLLGALPAARALAGEQIRLQLLESLGKEWRLTMRLPIWFSLCRIGDTRALPVMSESLGGTPAWYQRKVLAQLRYFDSGARNWAVAWARRWIVRRTLRDFNTSERGTVLLVLGIARYYPSDVFVPLISLALNDENDEIRRIAVRVAEELYPTLIEKSTGRSLEVRRAQLRTALRGAEADLDTVSIALRDPSLELDAIEEIGDLLRRRPQLVGTITEYAAEVQDATVRRAFSLALELHIPYLITIVYESAPDAVRSVVREVAAAGRSAALVGLMNDAATETLHRRLLEITGELCEENEQLAASCSRFLKPELRAELQLAEPAPIPGEPKVPLTRWDKSLLALMFVGTALLLPALFAVRNAEIFGSLPASEIVSAFVVDFNYLFAWYVVAINSIYLILLILSAIHLFRQSAIWAARDRRYLFSPEILPSVSIIAPAFNEEANIVQSVRSLLSLHYPEYEVVVVNDGSADGTLQQLLSAFDLERVDVVARDRLASAPLRGAYRSARLPNLLVLDKENGGKADALNCGITYAQKEYVCSIDSDSLLEREALVHIMLPASVDEREMLAAGGNIIPVNGSTVIDGQITEIHVPRNRLARYQTVEYLRAFIAGRMGWALINSLLIISGAFGVFRRKRVVEAGGYLTGTGPYRKDTVGEDMELVVRLIRHMRREKIPHTVEYGFNANCWTEVPEEFKGLLKQRDRWHRGLIDILTYYRAMAFNPRYGVVGLISIPYFLIFELLGPIVELLGYVVMVVGLVSGLLRLEAFLFLFTAIVLYGIVISISSLLLSERNVLYFTPREFFILLGTAVRENFGFRQFMSIWRTIAFAQYLFRNKGWQKLARKGFSSGA